MLAVVLFAGVATVGRLMMLNRDDFRWVVGMNRLRNGYITLHPELEPCLITSPYDDLPGALRTLGIDVTGRDRLGSVFHGLQTLPGMFSVIVAAVAGAIGALAALGFGLQGVGVLIAGAVAFVAASVLLRSWGRRFVTRASPSLEPRFPSPKP